MKRETLATGIMLAGVVTLASCACGAGSGAVKALASAGIQTRDTVIFGASCGTDHSIQPIFVGIGSLLILIGMSLRSLSAAGLAALGCAGIAVGHFVSGPSQMSSVRLPHADPQLLGFAAYVIGAVFLIAAFLKVLRSPKPLAAGTAMAGMAAVTGCSCCMITGSITALIASAGMPGIYEHSFVFFAGVAIISGGLWKLGGLRPALVAITGGAITYGGQKLLTWAMPELLIRGANFKFIPGYAIYFLGAATIMAGFVLAYQLAEQRYGTQILVAPLNEPLAVTEG